MTIAAEYKHQARNCVLASFLGMSMTMKAVRVAAVILVCSQQVTAQVVTFWPGGFAEHWTSPGTPVSHPDPQPVSLCPDGNTVDLPPSPCPRTSGFSMGMFHLNGAIYSIAQAATRTPSNLAGSIDQYATSPTYVADHLDGLFRYDDTGNPSYDGTYDRLPDFFALPANGQLHTLSDDSVKQVSTDTLPLPYRQPVSQGTLWQVGSAFTAFTGPPLANDSLGSHRLYAFFGPESYPADGAVGGHLIGFASVSVPAGANAVPNMWAGAWKDAGSPNDGEYKQANGLPLRTLYLKEFTPVIAFRGDTEIRRDMPEPRVKIGNGRYLVGMSGWYRDGYFYLFTNTLLSSDTNDHCTARTTRSTVGTVLFRIRADSTGTTGFRGLWLDGSRRPQVEVYRSATQAGPKLFVPLPYPERVVSFSDDDGPIVGDACDTDNRQNFSGCCDNPAVPASRALITNGIAGVSANFVWQDPCSRYVVLNPATDTNPKPTAPAWSSGREYSVGDVVVSTAKAVGFVCVQAGQSGGTEPTWPNVVWPHDPSQEITDNTVRWKMAVGSSLLRLRDHSPQCGTGDPAYSFEEAGLILHPYPAGYGRDQYYGPWANLWPLTGSADTLLGFRHLRRITSGQQGQASFTVVPDLLNCSMSISPGAVQIDANSHTGSITITAPETRCVWTARSSDAFVALTSATSGAGSSSLTYSVAANSGAQRTSTVAIAGKTFTITQAAVQIAAPAGLRATRQSTRSALVTWSASPGATAYELFRATTNGNFVAISNNAVAPYTDSSLASGKTYLYKVRARSGDQLSPFSNVDLTTTVLFSDDAIAAGETLVRANHINELRHAVNAVRISAGLQAGSFADDPVSPEATPIRAAHVSQLRASLTEALTALGLPALPFTEPDISAGTLVKSAHVTELRSATK